VKKLDEARIHAHWGSTLNNAAVISALTRYQLRHGGEAPVFSGAIRAGRDDPLPFTQAAPVSLTVPPGQTPVRITSSGRGRLYVAVTSRGLVRDDRIRPYQRGLSIERHWLDRDGQPVDANRLTVGDLVRVEIVVRARDGTIPNTAIVDALPGGLEVENPRLATSAELDEAAVPAADHVAFLDDRVVLFCTAGTRSRTYGYALRATTAGVFLHPPIQGSSMYDPALACLGRAGRVRIQSR
jgi:uncharacterized protein YfaS (alpha-2-macroglobulin family)